jgi:hypothetical protein
VLTRVRICSRRNWAQIGLRVYGRQRIDAECLSRRWIDILISSLQSVGQIVEISRHIYFFRVFQLALEKLDTIQPQEPISSGENLTASWITSVCANISYCIAVKVFCEGVKWPSLLPHRRANARAPIHYIVHL